MKFFSNFFKNKKTTEDTVFEEGVNGFKVNKYITCDTSEHEIFFNNNSLFELKNLKDVKLIKKGMLKIADTEYVRFYTEQGFVELAKLNEEDFGETITFYKKIYEEVLTELDNDSDVCFEFGDENIFSVNDIEFKRIIESTGLMEIPALIETIDDNSERKIFTFPFYHEIDDNYFETLIIDIVFENGYYKKNIYIGVEFEKNQYELI